MFYCKNYFDSGPGRVIINTYHLHNYSVLLLRSPDYTNRWDCASIKKGQKMKSSHLFLCLITFPENQAAIFLHSSAQALQAAARTLQ